MLVLILACVLVVLVLGSTWIYMAKQYIENDIYSSDIKDSLHMAESVTMYLNDIIHNIEVISVGPDMASWVIENDTGHLKQLSDNLLMSSPKPDGVAIVNETGHVLYGSRPTNLTNITILSWYGDMSGNNGSYVTGLYHSPPLNDYAFAILTPVKNNSSIVGRIMVVYTQENFQDSLKEHNIDPRDNIIVVDGHGDVISSNDLGAVNRNTDLSPYTPVQKVIRGESGVITHNDSWDGQSRISAYQPIPNSGWGVIVSTPTSVEYRPLYDQIELILGIMAIFIAVFSILGYYVSKFLADPIIDLSRTMQRISSGNSDVRVKMQRKDELGILANTFNEMMDKLEEAKAQSDIYLDLMGHDINNMNQVALGNLELADTMIRSGKTLGKGDEGLITKPISVLEDSSNLIDNLRKLQKIKTEELPIKAIDVSKILKGLKDQCSSIAGRDIRINFEYTAERMVRANELVKDVFSNLIWNAIKHSNPDKPLVINLDVAEALEGGKKYYRITVEDNGPGIAEVIKPQLFSRYNRGQTKAKGSGLGLYLVKTLVDKFSGRVWVEDRVDGDHMQGARFVVLLPAAEPS